MQSTLDADNPHYATRCAGITAQQKMLAIDFWHATAFSTSITVSDVMMWSQQFDEFVCFVKENYSVPILIIIIEKKKKFYYRHLLFQTNCKNMVKLMNVKEFDNFFQRLVGHLPVFNPNSIQNCESRFLSKMLNFTILSVFCPKRFCPVPTC